MREINPRQFVVSSASNHIKEDAAMMRLRKGRWFTNFFYKGKKIEVTLQTGNKRIAHINLGKVLVELENGVDISGSRKRISNLGYPKADERGKRVWELHIQPFFGSYKIPDVTGELIEAYMAHRWGTEAPQSTVKKELRVLRMVIQGIRKNWVVPEFEYTQRDLPFKSRVNSDHVEAALQYLGGEHLGAYMVMSETGMEPMDTVTLAPIHISDGIIEKIRSKSRRSKRKPRIKVSMTPRVKEGFELAPWPISPETAFFQNINNKSLTTATGRAFDRVFYPGMSRKALKEARKENPKDYPNYGPKDLRRYVATRLFNVGYGWDLIAQILGQVQRSRVTSLYTGVEDETVKKAFAEAF